MQKYQLYIDGIESLNHPFYVINVKDYTLELANSCFKTIFGESKPPKTCYNITHGKESPCSGKEHPCPLEEVKRLKKPVVMEHTHYTDTGTPLIYEIHSHPIFDDNRNVIRILEFSLDITERKKTETSLRESKDQLNEINQLFENIFNTTDTCIAYLDPQFNFVWVNRAYAIADDKNPEYFPGLNHFDLYPNEENEEIFKKVIRTGEPYFAHAKAFEYTEHPERGVSYWDWSLIPIKSLDNEIRGLILTIQNVTDRVQMQIALKESEEKYKNITEIAQEMILRVNLKGECTFINNSGFNFFEKSLDNMIGENILKFVHPSDVKNFESQLKNIGKTKVSIEGFTNLIIVPKGTRAIKWNMSPILNSSGEVEEIQASGSDVTELQEELVEKNKLAAVGQLAAGVAHELNTPLANINLIIEYLLSVADDQQAPLEQDKLKKELGDVKMQALLCIKIVQELLQFSRKIHLSPSKFILKSQIQDLINSTFFITEFSEKNITFIPEIEDQIEIIGDKSLLHQAFQNILKNAVDSFNESIDRKKMIHITAVKEADKIIINFKDNGTGIKKEDLSRVFEPFFTTKIIGHGTGLGLSIARGIIEKHKGKIKVSSIHKEGTNVEIILPLVQ
ncbi:PAS domain-containing protein [Candidatus Hodarchaeum mangrovi]